jgi:hypothetical protein
MYNEWPSIGTPISMPDHILLQFYISVYIIMSPCMFASFARTLTGCNVQDFIKFKLRIFGRPFEGYKPGFIHIILSLVSVS